MLKLGIWLSSLSLMIVLAWSCSSELRQALNLPHDAGPEEQLQKLDQLIQIHAFQALLRPRTGTIYDVPLPAPLQQGVTVQVVRLKTRSLQHRGFIFNEFIVPPRVLVVAADGGQPEYIVLVYRFFGMRYSAYCPHGYAVVGPVIGIKAYDGLDVVGGGEQFLPQSVLVAPGEDPITVRIPILPLADSAAFGPALCALFDGNASVTVTAMIYANLCSLGQLDDATLIVPAVVPAPAPSPKLGDRPPGRPKPAPSSPHPSSLPVRPPSPRDLEDASRSRNSIKVGLLGTLGAIVAMLVGAAALAGGLRMYQSSRIAKMEVSAASAETLETVLVGGSRPPAARWARTRPVLEGDYRFR